MPVADDRIPPSHTHFHLVLASLSRRISPFHSTPSRASLGPRTGVTSPSLAQDALYQLTVPNLFHSRPVSVEISRQTIRTQRRGGPRMIVSETPDPPFAVLPSPVQGGLT
ncbi:hypothetical protein C8Q77DRAFT_1102347 [Trametes polyzona]|nr:hypothetical protein C8Q77DRAFT_1102347 [Trametes polyzona]